MGLIAIPLNKKEEGEFELNDFILGAYPSTIIELTGYAARMIDRSSSVKYSGDQAEISVERGKRKSLS